MQAYSRPTRYHDPDEDMPILVAIIAVLMGIIGGAALILGLVYIFSPWASGLDQNAIVQFLNQYVIHAGPLTGILLAIGGAAVVSIAMGLWHQEAWSLWFCVVAIALGEVYLFFFKVPFSYIFLSLLILYIYLLAVRQHFKR